jgi:hypothetical protein
MRNYSYSINQFRWVKESNAFYAKVNDLTYLMNDGSIHPNPFPNNKSQFYIHNKKTGGFRRFRFTTERIYAIDYNNERYLTELIFESEDNIKCHVQQ